MNPITFTFLLILVWAAGFCCGSGATGMRFTKRKTGMRKCEKCKGGGPCLHDDKSRRYLCVRCHSNPKDLFFTKPT